MKFTKIRWKVGSIWVSLWPFVFVAVSVLLLLGYDRWLG